MAARRCPLAMASPAEADDCVKESLKNIADVCEHVLKTYNKAVKKYSKDWVRLGGSFLWDVGYGHERR